MSQSALLRPPSSASRPLLSRVWASITVRGVLALVLGLVAFAFPLSALVAFAILFAAYLIADGLLSIVAGLSHREPGHRPLWPLLLRGLIGLAIGALFFVLPWFALYSYALATILVTAVWALLTGALEVYAAVRLRHEMQGEALLLLSGLLTIIFGVIVGALIFASAVTTLLGAAWLLGTYLILSGIVLLSLGLQLRAHHKSPEVLL